MPRVRPDRPPVVSTIVRAIDSPGPVPCFLVVWLSACSGMPLDTFRAHTQHVPSRELLAHSRAAVQR